MRFHALAGIAVATLLATPALAGHCPTDVQAIDAALAKNPSLTTEQKVKVTELRTEGEQLHKSGDHGASVAALHEAMEILGLEHQ